MKLKKYIPIFYLYFNDMKLKKYIPIFYFKNETWNIFFYFIFLKYKIKKYPRFYKLLVYHKIKKLLYFNSNAI
jgi:hypothetical protein